MVLSINGYLPIMILKRTILLLLALFISSVALAQEEPMFVFVKIKESIMPIERGQKYEDPLDEALKKAKLGEVTGGGSSFSKERKIEWVGVDVDLVNLDKGLPFLKRKLIELGVPKGSTLEYELQGKLIEIPVHGL